MEEDSSTPTAFETRVTSGADDVEERQTGKVDPDSSDLEMAIDGAKIQTVGIRFTGIDIPQGAIITSAYIQFQTDEVSTGDVSLLIQGEDSDDATAFSTIFHDVSSRTTTDASVNWAPADWLSRGEAGLDQRTPDLAAVVQEIVNREGWAALNDMAFVITGTGTRTAEAYEGDAGGAPLLHIEWLPPGPVSDPVAFNDPPDADAAANQIGELAAVGAAVGITASAADPDPDDTVMYSIDDPRFAIDPNTGVITRSDFGTTDYETEPSITLGVTATSSDWSRTTQTFTLAVLDEQEPAAFNNPPDADPDPNRITVDAPPGTAVGITASAADPDVGDTVTYAIDDPRFAVDPDTGVIIRSNEGALDAQAEPLITLAVTATSSDGNTVIQTFDLNVTSDQLPTALILVNTVQTSEWSPPSSDPSGIAYIPHLGTLLISDGEVNEIPEIFTGDNLFEMSLGGALVSTLTAFSFSDEPTGVAYNPANQHLFFTDDTGTRSVYELDPGPDGLYNTSDDVVTSFKTRPFGLADAEGVAYDTTRGVLYLAGGADGKIFTIDPGPNGIFDGHPSKGGDDIATSFDAEPLGIHDPEGVEYDPVLDILYITASKTEVAMVTTTGELLGMLDISAASAKKPAGLALAPSSEDPDNTSLYIVDRYQDNVNDGKVYEFMFDDWLVA